MLIDLAEHSDEGAVSLKDVAERRNVSKKYLEQIVPVLSSSGLLKTIRGSHGGYMLAKPPHEYTVGEIFRITEGSLSSLACLDHVPIECERSGACDVLFVFQGLNDIIDEYLDSITLQDIIEQKKEHFTYNHII